MTVSPVLVVVSTKHYGALWVAKAFSPLDGIAHTWLADRINPYSRLGLYLQPYVDGKKALMLKVTIASIWRAKYGCYYWAGLGCVQARINMTCNTIQIKRWDGWYPRRPPPKYHLLWMIKKKLYSMCINATSKWSVLLLRWHTLCIRDQGPWLFSAVKNPNVTC